MLKQNVARRLREPEGGSFWQPGYYDEIPRLRSGFRQRAQTPAKRLNFNVWTEAKRIEKLRYIHRNPLRRGLVSSPEQWRWSMLRRRRSELYFRREVNSDNTAATP